MNVIV